MKGQEWLGGPHERPGVVRRISRRTGSGREALPEVQEWSGGLPIGPGVVGRPFRRVGKHSRIIRRS